MSGTQRSALEAPLQTPTTCVFIRYLHSFSSAPSVHELVLHISHILFVCPDLLLSSIVLTIHSPCLQDLPATTSPPTVPSIPQPSVQDLRERSRCAVNPHTTGTSAVILTEMRGPPATCSLGDKFSCPVCICRIGEGGDSWSGRRLGTREKLCSPVPRERQCRHIWGCVAEMRRV